MRFSKLKYNFRRAICFFAFAWFMYMFIVYSIFYNESQNKKSIKTDQHLKEVQAFRMKRFIAAKKRSKSITGDGEDGKPVALTDEEKVQADTLFAFETYNVVASEKIAMDRRIPDVRHSDCKKKKYPHDLPMASVVIIFCNESSSGLLRTIHSVINRSPPQYLKEVILVDDFSTRSELGRQFEDYINATWPDSIVSLHRSKTRLGLIRAKVWGAELAVGEVLVFLDAHCEAGEQWLEPLLSRIKERPKTIVCPMVDNINDKNLEYSRNGGSNIGGFTWSLHFTWRAPARSSSDPMKSPTMAGGLLAVGRDFFFHIGAYDRGMDTWGGENLEISFRVWMCGGELEFIPCSRVGHIFRGAHPYTFDNKDSHGYNSKRLAEVWMDNYKELFYSYRGDLINANVGDLSERHALRQNLKCKSFQWYLDNVYPQKFIMKKNTQAYGKIRNVGTDLCLDTTNGREREHLIQSKCQYALYSQTLGLSQKNELRTEEICLDVVGSDGAGVVLWGCHESGGNQLWQYNQVVKTLTHSSGYCLDGESSDSDVTVRRCVGRPTQQWEFEHVIAFVDLSVTY